MRYQLVNAETLSRMSTSLVANQVAVLSTHPGACDATNAELMIFHLCHNMDKIVLYGDSVLIHKESFGLVGSNESCTSRDQNLLSRYSDGDLCWCRLQAISVLSRPYQQNQR